MAITEEDFQAMLVRTQANMKGGDPSPSAGLSLSSRQSATRNSRSEAYTASKRTDGLNKTEARFAQYLGILKAAGQITEWWAQDWTFRLASDCRFTPDFVVMRNNVYDTPSAGGETAFLAWDIYDVKGRKNKKDGSTTYWTEEDAKIKIKVAARRWPMFNWYVAFPLSNGEWESVRIIG